MPSIGLRQTPDASPDVQANFQVLNQTVGSIQAGALSVLGGGYRKLAVGTGTATITGGTSANSANIPHGLASAPTTVLATARQTADTRNDWVANVKSRDATNIVVSIRGAAAESFAVTNPTTVTFDWVAIL